MKKIYNIPVYENAELLGAYLEGSLTEEDRRQIELELQNDPEMAELIKDDIIPNWDATIEEDFPDFDWTNDTPIDNVITELDDAINGADFDNQDDLDYDDIDTDDFEDDSDDFEDDSDDFEDDSDDFEDDSDDFEDDSDDFENENDSDGMDFHVEYDDD